MCQSQYGCYLDISILCAEGTSDWRLPGREKSNSLDAPHPPHPPPRRHFWGASLTFSLFYPCPAEQLLPGGNRGAGTIVHSVPGSSVKRTCWFKNDNNIYFAHKSSVWAGIAHFCSTLCSAGRFEAWGLEPSGDSLVHTLVPGLERLRQLKVRTAGAPWAAPSLCGPSAASEG